jgi:N-acetylglucosamine kinase-like BadF-type ATPase
MMRDSSKTMYLGVDGGGTKTEYLLINGRGTIAAHVKTETSHHLQRGVVGAVSIIRNGIEQACRSASVTINDIDYAFLGLPGFGESLRDAAQLEELISDFLTSGFRCGNDVEAGWAGSLACKPGINLVCGTGAIGYGKDKSGTAARSSGWGHFCGDEGSAFWLGKKVIELFSKQADYRMEKTAIYEIVRTTLGIKREFDLIDYVHNELKLERDKIAKLALIMFDAAQQCDRHALKAYKQVAYECSLTVKSILSQLRFESEDEVVVSYSGGVFKSGDLVLEPLRAYLEEDHVVLRKPVLDPVTGAALYAVLLSSPDHVYPVEVLEALQEQRRQGFLDHPQWVQ